MLDRHIDLTNTMATSDTIKELQKHQKKSLKQIRGLITEIVVKRKQRSGDSTAYAQGTLTKPPDLQDVRDMTKRTNQ